MTDWTQRQVDRQDTQVWLPLGAFLLSIRAQVLGVLLRSTENSMRRRTQHSGGWGGERGGGKREYKHNLMSHIQTQSSVGGGGGSVWISQSQCAVRGGVSVGGAPASDRHSTVQLFFSRVDAVLGLL